jgi:hypothetical protein
MLVLLTDWCFAWPSQTQAISAASNQAAEHSTQGVIERSFASDYVTGAEDSVVTVLLRRLTTLSLVSLGRQVTPKQNSASSLLLEPAIAYVGAPNRKVPWTTAAKRRTGKNH